MRALLRLVTFVVIAGLSIGIARADDREDARREFAAGQASDKQKDWQTAIEHYLRAYELVPHHFALYNIATDYERLGKLREAATWYERYVKEAPDSPDRDKVQRLIGELHLRPAQLSVRSIPDGARVAIDGAPAGVTPFTSTIRGGPHRIAVDKDRQHDEREITVEFGEPEDVQFTLQGASGTIDLRGTPVGAQITVDGMQVGVLPLQMTVAPGAHTVHVSEYGYTPFDTTVVVQPSADTPLDVALVRGGMGVYGAPGTKLAAAYLLGFAGGADLRGSGEMLLGELGIRVLTYDASVRIGRVNGASAVDILLRWTLTTSRLAPFFGVGYSIVTGGGGYEVIGGLRYDLGRGDRLGTSLLVESGLRYHAVTTGAGADAVLFVPLLASFQVTLK